MLANLRRGSFAPLGEGVGMHDKPPFPCVVNAIAVVAMLSMPGEYAMNCGTGRLNCALHVVCLPSSCTR